MSSETTGFLTLRAGTFQRVSRTTRERVVRAVSISDCPVTNWYVIGDHPDDKELDGHRFNADDQLLISVVETKQGEPLWAEDAEKIGVVSSDHASLHLPPLTFAHFWTAGEATNGATHYIEIVLKAGPSKSLSVTNVGLIESMPAPDHPSGGRIHPVVAEIRTMRGQFAAVTKSILVGIYILGATWILVTIFRWLRP